MTTRFKDAMARLATGVSILTCADGTNNYGITVSSLTSVGLNPPTVSVCVEGRSNLLEVLRKTRRFGVTVLSESQQPLGLKFSQTEIPYAERFKNVDLETINGCPLIKGGLAMLSCEIISEHTISENVVLFGRVTHVESHDGSPLLYFQRAWQKLSHA